jgi:glycosyltransferase involved in cell wall biosynthesis
VTVSGSSAPVYGDSEHSAPLATVIVPTRDRPRELERCVAALERQRLPGELEIVVVDDGSADHGAVEAALGDSERSRLIRLEGRGPAAARNAGAREARGEVVCFLDDDCEPEPRWAELLVGFAAANERPAAGLTRNGLWDSHLSEASQAIVDHLQLSSFEPDGRLGFAPSCNLACPAELAHELPFDESFPLAAGEDREWTSRAAERGMAPVYVPDAVVVHRHRLTPATFLRQHLAYGRGAARLARGDGGGALLGARDRFGLLLAGFRRGPAVGVLVGVAQIATAAGFTLERARLATAARAMARPAGRRGRRR